MQFKQLCTLFESVREAKGPDKVALVKNFLHSLEHHDVYPIIRLLLPKLDRDRPAYNIKTFKITRILIKMLQLPPGNDRNLLHNVSETNCNIGDVIFSILKKYISNFKSELTVTELNAFLDTIACRESDNKLDDLLLNVFIKSSPAEARWIIHIILKDLKLGIHSNRLLNCYHIDASQFYASNNNLKKVCEVLNKPQVKLHEIEINVFEPFRPMLSKRADCSNFNKCFADKMLIVENKFDGERFQLHMENGKFKYFSRNGYDYTEKYGDCYTKGIFTPKLHGVLDANIKRIILDGEMMLWITDTNRFGSKGMNMDVKKLNNGKYQPCFCIFDILLVNDSILTNQPLKKRLELLRKVFKRPEKPGTIVLSKYREITSKQDIVDALNNAVDNEEEGIIVKDLQSIYKCSDRNAGWFKLKMEFFDDVVHDMDVLVMGGCIGSSGKINSFFIGISSGNQFLAFGRISSGLTDLQLEFLNDTLKSRGIDYKSFGTKSEGKLLFGRDVPHIYIEPDKSCLLTIRASELIRTTNDQVKTPYTLRFPRVLEVRQDKPVDECLSMNELLELTRQNKAVIKLNKRHIELDEITARKSMKKPKLEVPNFDLKKIGDFLYGKRFHVLSGVNDWDKYDIYSAIKRAGGAISYKEDHSVDVMLVGDFDLNVGKLLKTPNRFDLVSVAWLQRVIDAKSLLDYKPYEILSFGYSYKSRSSSSLDYFGDSFIQAATKESLEQVLKSMKSRGQFLNKNKTVSVMREDFHKFVAYFDKFEHINDVGSKKIYSSFLDEIEFKYFNGTISEQLTKDVNLIIADKIAGRRIILEEFLETIEKGLSLKVKIVSKSFLHDFVK